MKCESCKKELSDFEGHKAYHIQCIECFSKTHALIRQEADKQEINFIGIKKFEPGPEPFEKDEK